MSKSFMTVTPQKNLLSNSLTHVWKWPGGGRKQNNCDALSNQQWSASQNSHVYWQSYLLTCPSTISPGKLQGREKEMSKHASLSPSRKQALTEGTVLVDAQQLWSDRNPSRHFQWGRWRHDLVTLAPIPGTEPHSTQGHFTGADWVTPLTSRLSSGRGFLWVPSAKEDAAIWDCHWYHIPAQEPQA